MDLRTVSGTQIHLFFSAGYAGSIILPGALSAATAAAAVIDGADTVSAAAAAVISVEEKENKNDE